MGGGDLVVWYCIGVCVRCVPVVDSQPTSSPRFAKVEQKK